MLSDEMLERLKVGLALLEEAMTDFDRRLQAVEKATLPQPYNPDEAEGGTAGGPVRMVCENHRDKARPDECDCGPGMRGEI